MNGSSSVGPKMSVDGGWSEGQGDRKDTGLLLCKQWHSQQSQGPGFAQTSKARHPGVSRHCRSQRETVPFAWSQCWWLRQKPAACLVQPTGQAGAGPGGPGCGPGGGDGGGGGGGSGSTQLSAKSPMRSEPAPPCVIPSSLAMKYRTCGPQHSPCRQKDAAQKPSETGAKRKQRPRTLAPSPGGPPSYTGVGSPAIGTVFPIPGADALYTLIAPTYVQCSASGSCVRLTTKCGCTPRGRPGGPRVPPSQVPIHHK